MILDIVGGDLAQLNLEIAAADARIICIGVMRGAQATINLTTLFMNRLTLTGSTLRRLEKSQRALCFQAIRGEIWPSVISGSLAPIIDTVYPMSNALGAHEHMQSGKHFGKLVLDCGTP